MRILSIDFGTRHMGIAITDDNQQISSALTTITFPKNNYMFVVDRIKKIKDEYNNIEFILLGHPVRTNNTKSETTILVECFKQLLENNLNIKVQLFDETYSTLKTTTFLKEELQLKGSQIRRIKDKMTAQIILQEFLELKKA